MGLESEVSIITIMRLNRNFFNRDTVVVARELLGKYLCRRMNGKILRAKITETEAYCGQKDLACHASKGLTERTKVMFGPPGRAYVYLIYGIYHCFNIVTREEGCPEAVLIRGAEIEKFINLEIEKLKGPGILCRELKIERNFNGVDVCKSSELWVESASRRRGEKPLRIKRSKRIGVDYAGEWKDNLWRFSID